MLQHSNSLLFTALEQAKVLLQKQQATAFLSGPLPEEVDEGDRGSLRSWSAHQPPVSAPTLPAAEAHLAKVSDEIAQMQAWLHARPELLQILDAGIRREVKQMEDRINRTALLLNTLFTLLGALLGLVLPPLVGWLFHIVGH